VNIQGLRGFRVLPAEDLSIEDEAFPREPQGDGPEEEPKSRFDQG